MEIKDTYYPLVSIIVITYNSSQFVIETLESTKSQTYGYIELIISDDCSTDKTVEVCKKWLESNKERFFRTELITTNKNRGVPANCNRSLKNTMGTWIKYIAGDDILHKDCINTFIKYSQNDEQKHSFLFCNKVMFRNNLTNIISESISNIMDRSNKKQLLKYACTRPNIAPFMFIKKDAILKLNGFDESYHLLEDLPLYFKALENNYNFLLINENLVYYRLNNSSISNSSNPSKAFTDELKEFANFHMIPFLFSKGLIVNATKTYIEYNIKSKKLHLYSLKILNKLSKLERKILYSI